MCGIKDVIIMKNNNIKRRAALKMLGIGSLASLAFTNTAAATEDSNRPNPHDIRVLNSTQDKIDVDVSIQKRAGLNGEEIQPEVAAELGGLSLQSFGETLGKSVSVGGGYYSMRAIVSFPDQSPATAQKEFAVPEGGIPAYFELLVSARGNEDVSIDIGKA